MYSFREIDLKDGRKLLAIDFEDKKKELLSVFLQIEVRVFAEYILEGLNLVIEYGSEYEEFNGNICGIEIRPNYTRIYDNLAEDGKGNWCEIETKELKKLIDMWLDKCEKYEKKEI